MAVPAFDPNKPFETLDFDPIAYTREKATELGLDPDLAVSVGQTESGWNLKARSPKGAYGPFQLMAGTARELGVNRFDPRENIDGGLTYLKRQIDEFKDPSLGVAAYNAGPGAVRKHGGVPPFAETQDYVRKVMGSKAPPAFDPDAPAEVVPPPFDPKKPFDVLEAPSDSTASPPAAPQPAKTPEAHPLKGALARLAEQIKAAGATYDADRKERTTAALQAMRDARSVSTDPEGRMLDPTEPVQDLIGGISGAFGWAYAPIGAAIDTAMGRPLEKVLQNAPHGKIGPLEYDARFGKNFLGDAVGQIGGQMVGGPKAGELAAAERAPGPTELVAKDTAARVGKGFRDAVFGEQLPKLAPEEAVSPGAGKFVDAKTATPLSKGQEAIYEQMRTSGELDPNAAPGSRNFPRAQRAPEDLPPPGEWYVDLTGELKQSPEIAPEAPRVAPEMPQEPVEAPAGVMPHEEAQVAPAALPEPPPFDPAQPFEVAPAFDHAAPFEALDDFPGDRPEVKAAPGELAAVDLTDRALDLIRNGKEVRQKRGQSLVDALSAEGGVRNEGGELSAFDPRAYGQRGGRLMRQNGGMSLDDAALWAQERGYIGKPVEAGERASPQELLEALRRDLDGDRVYAREDPAGAELAQHADDLEEMLHELGVDPHQATNAEIKRALSEYFSAPAEHRDTIYGVRSPKSPDQLELPGVDGATDTKASILLELQRRSAKRAAEPMEAGGLFDEVRKGEQGLFDDKPAAKGPFTTRPRESTVPSELHRANNLGYHADRLYRETNLEDLELYLPNGQKADLAKMSGDHFMADAPELARGQGENTGVLLEFDPQGLKGKLHQGKPGLEFSRAAGGGSEYVARYNHTGDYRKALTAVRIDKGAEVTSWATKQRLPRFLADLEKRGWIKTETPEYTQYERPAAPSKPMGLRTTEQPSREHVGRLQDRYAAATTNTGLREAPRPTAVARLDAAKPEPLPREAARVQDMVGRLQRAMDVTHRQGRMTLKGKDVLGEYNPASGVVRTRNMGVMDETAHEYFHDLDFRNLPTLRKTVDAHAAELSALDYEPPAADGSRRAAAKAEGFAEFGRWYVTNPTHAQKVAPKFYRAFEAALGKDRPKMLKAIKGVQADYAKYQKAPSADRLAHAVVSTADKGPVKALLGRVKQDGPGKVFSDWAHGLYFAGQDKLHGLTRWEHGVQRVYFQNTGKALELEGKDSPQQLARLMSNAAGDGFADLTEGVRMPGQIKGEGPKLPEVLDKAYKGDWSEKNRSQFSAYLIARRLVNEWDRFGAGKIPKEPHRTTREDALQAIADFEKAHPEWKALSDQVNEHQALVLRKSKEAGLITKEAYEEALKEHPFYVPLNRDLSDKPKASTGGKPGDGATSGGLDRFVGSTRDFVDPIESIMRRSLLQSAVIKANDVKVAMAAAAKKAGRGSGFFAEEVPNSEIKAINVAADQAMAAAAKEMGVDIEDVREALMAADLQLEPGAKLTMFKAQATTPRGEPMVFYWQDGQRHALRLGDDSIGKQVYEALADLGKPASNLFLNILAPPARLLQTGVTTHPAYFLANTMRDAIASVANTPWGVNFKPLVTTGRGIVDDLAHSENAALYDRFGRVRGGAAMASQREAQFHREVAALRKRNIIIERFSPVTKKPGQLPRINLGAVAHLAELSEAGTRLGVYRLAMKRALKEGLDPESAAVRASNEAADILAFDRHGARMFTAHKAVTFLNAWQQGMDKFVRSATAPTAVKKMIRGEKLTQADVRALKTAGGKWWPVFATTGIVGLLQSIAYHDDPEYQEISPYLRANHWFFRPEDIGLTAVFPDWAGKWVAIPKPFELAAPSNVVERMFEATVDKDDQAVERMWQGLGQLLMPPSGIPLLATHEQVLKNRDYNGKPIIPEHKMGAGDPELKVNAYTSAFSKGLAHEVGDATEALTGKRKTFSPAVADHWIQSLMASWGRSFLSESNRVDAAMKGKPQPHLGPDEGLVSARFVRDVTRSSQSQADFWKKVGKDEGEYEGAFNDISAVYKDDPADALKRLSKMPEDVRDYALAKMFGSLAMPDVPGGASKLHPMARAREITSVISDIRQKVRDGKLTTPTRAIPLNADQQRDADDALSHLAMAEMRDALIASGAKGYGNKVALSTAEDREKLRAIDPGLIEALDGEAAARNIPDQDTVTRAWPQLQLRLRAASEAQLQAAMAHKSTRTKRGKYDALSRMNEALLAQ